MTVPKTTIGTVLPIKPQPRFERVEDTQVHKIRRKQLLDKHPQLDHLQKPHILSAVYVVAIIVAQHYIATYVSRTEWSYWAIFGLAYVVGATLVHAMWVLVHDLTHDCVFKSKFMNQFFHLVANIPILIPSTMSFRYYHRLHHAYLNEAYNDPDLPSPWENRVFGGSALGKATWLLLFGLLQSVRVVRYHARADLWTALNFIIQFAYAGFVVYAYPPQAIFYMAISSWFSIGLHPLGARWIAEHYATNPGQETYSYYGPLNLVSFNIGFHNEHHDLPRVPWVNLPAVSKMAPEFYSDLAEHPSYLAILFQFIFNPGFSLESRVIHPSYQQLCEDTQLQERSVKDQ